MEKMMTVLRFNYLGKILKMTLLLDSMTMKRLLQQLKLVKLVRKLMEESLKDLGQMTKTLSFMSILSKTLLVMLILDKQMQYIKIHQ